ncbi:8602_t:CDS:2 [Cetraspora pellucida]|uniref:8602_t:CDS:1 n=1 Tax=Cetraspora pellucida TaxID=1433469 RepID=A0A9N9ESN3_9GLOM|nr:8602_t:CDS:2 [Cetraspora pellucida]
MSSANSYLSRLLKIWKQTRFPWRQQAFVGSDLSGNDYYESYRLINGRKKRTVEMKEKKPLGEYNSDSLPVQWQSWLRHTRFEPPTIEEIIMANKRRELIIQRAKALDKDWERRKEELSREVTDKSKSADFEGQDAQKKPAQEIPLTIPSGTFEPKSWEPRVARK